MQETTVDEAAPGLTPDELEAATEKAQKQGHLAEREAEEILEIAGDDPERIDAVITGLVNVKIDEEARAAEEPEEVTAEELEKVLDAEGTALDDPVRMYLR
ncbi:MAG: hypothetical protein JOZ41_19140, partial [Chloroflexi bacterium]|nr:hypothetical protein [Chloroflexota bacterium]